jgi:hypothetical protein
MWLAVAELPPLPQIKTEPLRSRVSSIFDASSLRGFKGIDFRLTDNLLKYEAAIS